MKDDPTLINRVILPSNRLPVPKLKLNLTEKVRKTIPTSIMHYQEDTGPEKSVEKDRASQFQRFLKKGKSCNESLSRRLQGVWTTAVEQRKSGKDLHDISQTLELTQERGGVRNLEGQEEDNDKDHNKEEEDNTNSCS